MHSVVACSPCQHFRKALVQRFLEKDFQVELGVDCYRGCHRLRVQQATDYPGTVLPGTSMLSVVGADVKAHLQWVCRRCALVDQAESPC
jgi:hypothetical protein